MKHNRTLRLGLSVLLSLVMCLSLLPATALAVEGVAINATNFPDETFRENYVRGFDTDESGTLSAAEIAVVTSIDCSNQGISDLTGIEHFTALTKLECYENQLAELDVSNNTKLEYLDCYENQLPALNIASNTALEFLDCYGNQLTELDVSSNTALTYLDCGGNSLTSLNVSCNRNLETLGCYTNSLTELDVSSNTKLEYLYCNYNYLTALDVRSNPALTELYCNYNGLTTLDVSKNEKLEYLYCYENYLTELDVRSNTALKELDCHYNQLTTLDVSENTELTTLICYNNHLTSLDISETAISDPTDWNYLHIGGDSYDITLDENRAFDLRTLPEGFDIEKVGGWTGGTVEDGILTFDSDVVTYTYDCGKEKSETFTLDASTKYTVTAYGLYGRTVGIVPGATYTQDYAAGRVGRTVSLQVTCRDGYRLKDWIPVGIEKSALNFTADGTENDQRSAYFTMPANDVIVTFVWEKTDATSETKTITLNANGGYVALTSVETGEDGKLRELLTPTRDGYTFDGWFTEKGTTAVTTGTVFSEDTVLYAHWTQNDVPPAEYIISFAPNGGTLVTGAHATTETDEYGTLDYFAAATCEGYTFDGWYTKKTGGEKVAAFTKFNRNTVIYAHWTPEAQTKQITEAIFALKGYTAGANAEDIVITSYTEGLSLPGGYLKAKDIPFAYILVKADNPEELATGPLEVGVEYLLMLRADVAAGYDTGLTKSTVTLNGISAIDYGRNFDETIGCGFMLPPVPEGGTTYTAAVIDSYAPATGAGEYMEGDTVTLSAGSRSGYTFSGWTVVSGNVTLANPGSAIITFAMPASAVTVQANWTQIVPPPDKTKYTITVNNSGGGAISVTATGLDDGEEATIIVAQYKGAQLVDVRTESITGTGSVITKAFVFTASKGGSYKIFLLNSTSVPLCDAKRLTLG